MPTRDSIQAFSEYLANFRNPTNQEVTMPLDNIPAERSTSASTPDDWKPLRRPDVISQPAGAETLLYDPETDSIHMLNRTALAAWEQCDGSHTRADIATALQAQFASAADMDVRSDVDALLALFSAHGLLHADGSP